MRSSSFSALALGAILITTIARGQDHKYDYWDENYSAQGLLGAVKYEGLKFDAPDSADPIEIDASLLPQLGGGWATAPLGGERFQYGLETTFLLGFRFDKVNYAYLGGGGAYINLTMSMWMFDLAGGPYASLFLDEGQRVRLYGGAGPLITYAYYQTEQDFTDTTPTESESESVFGIGAYARAGLEFRVHRYGMLGVGARATYANADFSEYGGTSDLKGIAGFVTYTAGF